MTVYFNRFNGNFQFYGDVFGGTALPDEVNYIHFPFSKCIYG